MRFLLVFHSKVSSELRLLDTLELAHFDGQAGLSALPAALREEGGRRLEWLLGQYDVAGIVPEAAAQQHRLELAEIYPLEPDLPLLGSLGEYRGAWLEILRAASPPLAFLGLSKTRPSDSAAILRARETLQVSETSKASAILQARAERPLSASHPACSETLGALRRWQAGSLRRRRARPVARHQARPKSRV